MCVSIRPAAASLAPGSCSSLTPREYQLLELLMRNPGRAVSRETILESVWGFNSDVTKTPWKCSCASCASKSIPGAQTDPHGAGLRLHDAGAVKVMRVTFMGSSGPSASA